MFNSPSWFLLPLYFVYSETPKLLLEKNPKNFDPCKLNEELLLITSIVELIFTQLYYI